MLEIFYKLMDYLWGGVLLSILVMLVMSVFILFLKKHQRGTLRVFAVMTDSFLFFALLILVFVLFFTIVDATS